MKFIKAAVILSGLSAQITHNFKNGVWSNFHHSDGNLTISGFNSLNQSLNLAGKSFSIESGNFSNSSISPNHKTDYQALLGNHSYKLFSQSLLGTQCKR